ncbi:DHS-like NAD/FAD-binding domain-containing protein [Bisporella sp. PMI_857]|nr:DHS-like NAD/FAD-binding domain-containing protein [Bisporella sp. PMI_857]
MGQEQSQFDSRPLSYIADYLQKAQSLAPKRKVVVLTGAGVSTSAGIPDFRSPETGLYANLARLKLPYPEAVFSLDFFRENPAPFYALAKELYPGKYFPTISHAFIALLHEKELLSMLFTQNIDCLDRKAGVPDEKIVEAHGSFATQRCIECKTEFPDDLMKKAVDTAEPPHCIVPQCNGLVKPDIVFFGEGLPPDFFTKRDLIAEADLLIVMGTSLAVAPFAHLPHLVQENVPRVLFNREQVGNFGAFENDCIVLDDCDAGVRQLADALGWTEELEALFLKVGGKVHAEEAKTLKEARLTMSKDEILEAEIEKISEEVEKALNISKDHQRKVNEQIEKDGKKYDTSESSEKEDVPMNTKKVIEDEPAGAPVINRESILDVTLPQNKPNNTSESKPSSHI